MVGAYDLKFDRIGIHWDKVKSIIAWIKMTVPVGERDYDDINKVWTIAEKFYPMLKEVLDTMGGGYFDISVIEKPLGGASVSFVATSTYLEKFKQHSNVDISKYGEDRFNEAKKIYFKTALNLHPDRHPDDPEAGNKMSDFNEAWTMIKERHFKIVQQMEQTI